MVKRICSIVLAFLMCCSFMIPALAEEVEVCEKHKASVADNIKKPTCVTLGVKYFTCELCGEQYEEYIPMLSDNEAHVPAEYVEWEYHFQCGSNVDGYRVKKCPTCGVELAREELKAADHKNHTYVEEAATAATCYKRGNTAGKVCSICGNVPSGSTYTKLDKIAHSKDLMTLSEAKSTVTCTEAGVKVYECKWHDICGQSIKEEVEALGHELKVVNDKTATCTATGYTGDTVCARCDYKAAVGSVIEINPNNHNFKFDHWKEGYEGDCEKNGVQVELCANGCGKTREVNYTAPGKHDYKLLTAEVAPNCITNTNGKGAVYECKVCHKRDGGETILPRHTKPADPSKIEVKEADCVNTGYVKYQCVQCNKNVMEITEAKGHNWDTQNAVKVPATCTEAGSVTTTCKTCKTVKVETLPAKGHSEILVAAYAGDCTTPATGEHTICANCNKIKMPDGKYYDKDADYTYKSGDTTKTVKAISMYYSGNGHWKGRPSHNGGVVDVPAVKATCTTDGNDAYKRCTKCGAEFQTDGYPRTPGFAIKKATGHVKVYDSIPATFATCDKTGLTAQVTCVACNQIIKEPELVPMLAHEYESVTVEPICKEEKNGTVTKTCKTKHNAYVLTDEGVKALGSKYTVEVDPAHPSYYKKDAEGKFVVEQVPCGEKTVTIIEFKHKFVPEVIKAPTCVDKGETLWTCSECGKKYNEITAALGHEEEYVDRIEPTCSATGLGAGVKCKRCGLWRTRSYGEYVWVEKDVRAILPIDKEAHKLDWQNVEPTCTETGKKGALQCKYCKLWQVEVDDNKYVMVETDPREVIFATGHNWKKDVSQSVAATVDAEGKDVYYCAGCGETYTDVLPKLSQTHNHVYRCVETKSPTCLENGYEKYKCDTCDAEYQTTIMAKGHTPVLDPAVAATCTTAGKTEGVHCSTCLEVIKEQTVVPALGHTEVVDAAVAATCTTAGKTAGSHCSVCGTVIKAQEFVAAKGHKTVTKNAKKATYFAAGYTGDKVCSVCGKVITKGKAIAKLVLAKPSIKVTAGSKKLTVKISKKVTGATGYQVSYKVKGGKAKTVTVKSLKKVISKLSTGKTYTVKVRALVKSGSKTVYGSWSSAKSVKVK